MRMVCLVIHISTVNFMSTFIELRDDYEGRIPETYLIKKIVHYVGRTILGIRLDITNVSVSLSQETNMCILY